MKFYSEVLNRNYNSAADCLEAERIYAEEVAAQKKRETAEAKALKEKIEKASEKLDEAKKEYYEALEEYCAKYKYYPIDHNTDLEGFFKRFFF